MLFVDVGKAKGGGCHQDEIQRLFVTHYYNGLRVVRLKGGDPYLFGRGSEEVRTARWAGFDVEVVPGVSSALVGAVARGDRGHRARFSGQVTIVTGHRVEADNDWAALAAAPGTIVVLMAATTGPSIAARLIAAGMATTTPVAVVSSASCVDQQVGHGDLAALAAHDGGLPGPCVVVIGDVAATTLESAERPTTGKVAGPPRLPQDSFRRLLFDSRRRGPAAAKRGHGEGSRASGASGRTVLVVVASAAVISVGGVARAAPPVFVDTAGTCVHVSGCEPVLRPARR